MNLRLRADAEYIVREAINANIPDKAVTSALSQMQFPGRVLLLSVGKAAFPMARAALETLGGLSDRGIVISKYGHIPHPLPPFECFEAGHPVPDENTVRATRAALEMTRDLSPSDTVLVLLSGGGSSLFEDPLIPLEDLKRLTDGLLASGCGIEEINAVRKRLSRVKGGRFALWCNPAHVECLVLSDVIGNRLDMIASGPCAADSSSCEDALRVIDGYSIPVSEDILRLLANETPKSVPNARCSIIGDVNSLIDAAARACAEKGYSPVILSRELRCEAKDAGKLLAESALSAPEGKTAFIAGGETVVRLSDPHGRGGRSQEAALSAAGFLSGRPGAAVFAFGSDGTDGPTDAAGGYADGDTLKDLKQAGADYAFALGSHDAYNALKAVGNLIVTGPTGTNVNDLYVALKG
jgi:hydroxypyruvate reductase